MRFRIARKTVKQKRTNVILRPDRNSDSALNWLVDRVHCPVIPPIP
jgi:hypothetical protein